MMEELQKQGNMTVAAVRSGMDRETAQKYRGAAKLPSEMTKERHWRTRVDPLVGVWRQAEGWLQEAPELEALALFEMLLEANPEHLGVEHLRTFQHRVKRWRAQHGPEQEVHFAQCHRPGEALQTDFSNCGELNVTIAGEALPHLLCHVVLHYSNWQWATFARSELLMALRRGLQSALFTLGKHTEFHQTDNSTAATHETKAGRKFNDE